MKLEDRVTLGTVKDGGAHSGLALEIEDGILRYLSLGWRDVRVVQFDAENGVEDQ